MGKRKKAQEEFRESFASFETSGEKPLPERGAPDGEPSFEHDIFAGLDAPVIVSAEEPSEVPMTQATPAISDAFGEPLDSEAAATETSFPGDVFLGNDFSEDSSSEDAFSEGGFPLNASSGDDAPFAEGGAFVGTAFSLERETDVLPADDGYPVDVMFDAADSPANAFASSLPSQDTQGAPANAFASSLPSQDTQGAPADADGSADLFRQNDAMQIIGESEHKTMILKRVLIIVIIIAVLLLASGLFFLVRNSLAAKDSATFDTSLEGSTLDATASHLSLMPNLDELFGLTVDEALADLGSSYLLDSTRDATDEEKASDIQKVALVAMTSARQDGAYVTQSDTSTDAAARGAATVDPSLPQLSLSLDSHNEIIGVRYVADFSVLGLPLSSFADLVVTDATLVDILEQVGITLSADYRYETPLASSYTTYVDASAATKAVSRENYTFSGKTDSATAPTKWDVTFTYDYGTSSTTGSLSDTVRTLTLVLS